jgi:hypothetical protein
MIVISRQIPILITINWGLDGEVGTPASRGDEGEAGNFV